MRFLALVRDTVTPHTRADSPASLSSPPRHLCRSPGPGPSVASPSCPKPHLSRAVKLTPAQTTHIRALTRTLQIIDATEPAARTRGYAPPRVPSPRIRERARVCAPRLRPVALAAATALPRRQQPRRRRPPPPRRAVRRAARAVAVERAPRCRSSPRASTRGAPSAAGAAGSARYDASQAEPRRRRGRSRSLPRARRSPPIRTRPWRPSRPARKPQSLPEVPPERRGESVAAVARPMAVRAGLIEARR